MAELQQFYGADFWVFAAKLFGLLVLGLMAVYFMQFYRNKEWFDRNGAATEMRSIRERHGTEEEWQGDAQAIAIQYGAVTLFLAIVILSFFIAHS